jgi:hypothetical protein
MMLRYPASEEVVRRGEVKKTLSGKSWLRPGISFPYVRQVRYRDTVGRARDGVAAVEISQRVEQKARKGAGLRSLEEMVLLQFVVQRARSDS